MARDRNKRKEELLAAARDRLTEEQESRQNDSGREIRYRGQVMRQASSGTPGSGIGARRPAPRSGGDNDVRAALEKIRGLYKDGLISRAEAEKKRSEILERL